VLIFVKGELKEMQNAECGARNDKRRMPIVCCRKVAEAADGLAGFDATLAELMD
jgi:hypothetical protein